MYAIVEIAGQQFKVENGKKIFVHRLESEEGKEVEFDKVLLIEDEGKITIGEPTIKDAVLFLAKVGGFLARKGDGEPGAKVIWQGLMALDHITAMFAIFKGKKCG